MVAVRRRSQGGLRGRLLMRMLVVVLVVVVVRVWVALVLVLSHRGGCSSCHVDVVRMGVTVDAGSGRAGATQMGGWSRRSCCCGRRCLLVVQDMSVMRVVSSVCVMGVHMVGVDMSGSCDMMVMTQEGRGRRIGRRHLVHVQRPLLILRLGSPQGRLQSHHPLAVRRQSALLARAVAELAVPLVSL